MFMHNASRFAVEAAMPVAAEAPMTGLTARTLVDTSDGWRPATALRIGTGVHTAEGGVHPVLALDRRLLPAGTLVVRLPGGSFDNCETLDLMPDQIVDLDGRDGSRRIAARHLVGRRGVRMVRLERSCECVTPLFAEDEVIWTNSGTRLFCGGVATAESQPLPPRVNYLSEALRKVST